MYNKIDLFVVRKMSLNGRYHRSCRSHLLEAGRDGGGEGSGGDALGGVSGNEVEWRAHFPLFMLFSEMVQLKGIPCSKFRVYSTHNTEVLRYIWTNIHMYIYL